MSPPALSEALAYLLWLEPLELVKYPGVKPFPLPRSFVRSWKIATGQEEGA